MKLQHLVCFRERSRVSGMATLLSVQHKLFLSLCSPLWTRQRDRVSDRSMWLSPWHVRAPVVPLPGCCGGVGCGGVGVQCSRHRRHAPVALSESWLSFTLQGHLRIEAVLCWVQVLRVVHLMLLTSSLAARALYRTSGEMQHVALLGRNAPLLCFPHGNEDLVNGHAVRG